MTSINDTIAALNALPATQNRYAAFEASLWSSLHMGAHTGFDTGLRITQGLLSAMAIVAFAAIFATIKSGSFWLARFRETPSGRILTINVVSLFPIGAIILAVIDIAWAQMTYSTYYDNQPIYKSQMLCVQALRSADGPREAPAWAFFSLLFWCEAYVASTSTFIRYSHRLRATRVRAWMIHAAFSAVMLVLAAAFVLFCLGTDKIRRAENTLNELRAAVQVKAAQWQPGEAFSFDSSWVPVYESYAAQSASYLDVFRKAFGVLCAITLINLLVGVPSTLSHIRLLQQQMHRSNTAVQSVKEYGAALNVSMNQLESRRASLRRTYRSLAAEVAWTSLTCVCFAGLSLWFAVSLSDIFASPVQVLVAFMLGFGFILLTALPVVTILLVRSVRTLKHKRRQQPVNWAQKVQIRTEVVRAVDSGVQDGPQPITEAADHYDYAFAQMQRDRRNANLTPNFQSADLAFISLRQPQPDKFGSNDEIHQLDQLKA